ncbi:MAG TPA: proton-conducting transporter membrane subunit [Myxococcota bacterium]|nr:proton-conducting transporter membrane subunit [Myxococcota bacterium]HRY97048.1 proton-conducting transporter membrane subunit [Myxococcota bacterium]
MGVARFMAEAHVLLWIVPAISAVLLSGLGARLGNRWLNALALAGNGWTCLQALLAGVYFLYGPADGVGHPVIWSWMTLEPFGLVFNLDGTGAWAIVALAGVTLAAQLHAAASVGRLAGRHRFAALMQIGLASGAMLACAGSPLVMLVGWEGQALAAAFLAGFWEPEAGGGRTGMRWLLFQRLSGLLLMLGLFTLGVEEDLGLGLILAAAAVRAGQVPFHGWLPDIGRVPVPAGALLHGAWSSLPAVLLLVRIAPWVESSPWAVQAVVVVGLAGVLLGALAALQQPVAAKALGWLFVLHGGLAFLGLAFGDPVAALLLASGQAVALGGMTLAAGVLTDPLAGLGAVLGLPARFRGRLVFGLVCTLSLLPPGLTFLGFGRLLAAAPQGTLGKLALAAVLVAGVATGWVAQRVVRSLGAEPADEGLPVQRGLAFGPWLLAAAAPACGALVLWLNGPAAAGGEQAWPLALLGSGAALAGAGLGWLVGRGRRRVLPERLAQTQLVTQWLADTGLGLGAAVVQVSVVTARALGVIVWRVLGEWIMDGLVVATAYRTVQGIGMALRGLQNGNVHRYMLVITAAALGLVLWMLR